MNVGYYKTLAFALSAAWPGIAGSLYALATGFVSSDAFPFQLSIALLVGAVVGGIGTIGGALIGGLLVEFLPIYSQQLLLPVSKDLANAAPGAVQGVLLLIVLGLARGGVAGLLERPLPAHLRTAIGALRRTPRPRAPLPRVPPVRQRASNVTYREGVDERETSRDPHRLLAAISMALVACYRRRPVGPECAGGEQPRTSRTTAAAPAANDRRWWRRAQ